MSILKIVFVIIGTLIGAGFASGQEIYIFFFSYGIKGILGIIISSSIIGLIIYKTLKLVKTNNCKDYKELLEVLIRNEKGRYILNIVVNVFILASFYIMVAGFGAYIEQEFNVNSIIGSGVLAIICYIVFKSNIKGFVIINQILIPLIVLIVVFIGYKNLNYIDFSNIDNYLLQKNNNWILSAVLYASYNSILLVPVLISIKDLVNKKQNIKYISIIVTLIVILLSSIIYLFLIRIDVDINNLQMPAVYVVNKISSNLKFIYGLIIIFSIFTTAISLGISFLKDVAKSNRSYNLIAVIICSSSVVFSKIGFSNLVNLLYPILGSLGVLQIWKILLQKNIKTDITIVREKIREGI